MIGFATEYRSDEDVVSIEDVADQEWSEVRKGVGANGVSWRRGRSMLRPYKRKSRQTHEVLGRHEVRES